jgi:hypothetical protein
MLHQLTGVALMLLRWALFSLFTESLSCIRYKSISGQYHLQKVDFLLPTCEARTVACSALCPCGMSMTMLHEHAVLHKSKR